MDLEVRSRFAHERTSMENNTLLRIAKYQVKVIIRLCPCPLCPDICPYGARRAEQEECLVNQVRTQVVEGARAGDGMLPPTIVDCRTIAIIVRLVGPYFSQQTCLQEVTNGQKIVIPPAILVDTQHDIALVGEFN